MVQSGRIKQKYGKKYNKRRAWDLFSYLAKEITVDLKCFKRENTHSIPGTLYNQVLEDFGYKQYSDIPEDEYTHTEIEKESVKRWNEIIDKMIWSFEEIAEEYPHDPFMNAISEYHDKYPKKEDESFEEFFNNRPNKNRPDFDDTVDRKALNKEKEEYRYKIEEGLHLFAEWFENLWD